MLLQSATKLLRHCTQIGQHQRTKESTLFPMSPPFKVGVFVVLHRQLEQRHNIAWRGRGRRSDIFSFKVRKTSKETLQGKVSQLILSPIVDRPCPYLNGVENNFLAIILILSLKNAQIDCTKSVLVRSIKARKSAVTNLSHYAIFFVAIILKTKPLF